MSRNLRNFGGTTQLIYDNCDYYKRLRESMSPGEYALYFGQAENENKCIIGNVYFKQDPCVVDVESELKNIRRPYSKCDKFQYRPNCYRSNQCISTFDPTVPKIPDPTLCPIVFNNNVRPTDPGFRNPFVFNNC